MVDHLWTVACGRAVVDKTSNNISLLEVLERVNITGPGTEGIAPLSFDLVTLWARSDFSQPARINARLRLVAPDGTQIGEPAPYDVNLQSHPRARNITRFGAFPFRGAGNHKFVIEVERDSTWTAVAAVPLEIVLQGPETTASGQAIQ